jgi:hypothetical protein
MRRMILMNDAVFEIRIQLNEGSVPFSPKGAVKFSETLEKFDNCDFTVRFSGNKPAVDGTKPLLLLSLRHGKSREMVILSRIKSEKNRCEFILSDIVYHLSELNYGEVSSRLLSKLA